MLLFLSWKKEIDRMPWNPQKDLLDKTTTDKSLSSHYSFHRLLLSGGFRVANSKVK